MKQYRAFAVYFQELRPSRNGGYIWELHLVDCANPNICYHTWINEDNRNYQHWRRVIENPTKGIFLETERLRMRDLVPGQINADTVFDITLCDCDALADHLASIWHAPGTTTYRELFSHNIKIVK